MAQGPSVDQVWPHALGLAPYYQLDRVPCHLPQLFFGTCAASHSLTLPHRDLIPSPWGPCCWIEVSHFLQLAPMCQDWVWATSVHQFHILSSPQGSPWVWKFGSKDIAIAALSPKFQTCRDLCRPDGMALLCGFGPWVVHFAQSYGSSGPVTIPEYLLQLRHMTVVTYLFDPLAKMLMGFIELT